MPRRLTVSDVVHDPLPGMDAPSKVRFSPDGSALIYLQGDPGSLRRSLWWHDLAGGERRLVAQAPAERETSRHEELRRERLRERGAGVTDYQLAADGSLLTVLDGRVHVARAGNAATAIPAPGSVQDARLSADGKRVAVVSDGDAFVMGADGSGRHRLSEDAEPGVSNGLPDYLSAEELDRHVGMWWSFDGASLAFAHVDERGVPVVALQHLGEPELTIEEHHYPLAGGANPRTSLRVADLRAATVREAELGMAPDDYLARVVAHPPGGWLVAVLPRDQRSLRWLRVATDGSAQELWVERSEPWLNLDHDTRVLADGRILRSTERSGFRHLELRDADGGPLGELTRGEWVVTGVVDVDPSRGEVVFVGTLDGVLERHVYAVGLGGGDPRRLSEEPGWHEAALAPGGERWADTWSSLERAPAVVVRARDGSPAILIHEPSATATSAELPPPELVEVRAADGVTTLHAAVYPASPAGGPPPAVVAVYGGPHSQKVARAWSLTVDLQRQLLRQLGFTVVAIDNRGTFNRGLAFEAPLHREMGCTEVADQAAAVRQLAARGVLDEARVGITGASYGGYMTLMAMEREPRLFRAGVAVAPVTDWRLYDSAYTERYMTLPATNAEGYRSASALEDAGALAGQLLIIHGLIDENVHFRHAARLLSALAERDRDVELLVFPAERHGERGPAARRQRQRATVRFLCRALGVALPAGALD